MKRTYKTFTLAAAVVLLAAAGLSATAGDRVSARVSEPVSINGQTFPAGLIQVNEIRDYSPGVTMNEIRVDGRSVGMILARAEAGNDAAQSASLIFTRDAAGTLVLDAVAMRNEPVRQLMAFRSVDGHGEWYMPGDEKPGDGTLVAGVN